ncbi:MAG: hypothetical protein Q9162_001595 [Coniocarpon cinnabarinum]
MRVEMAPLGVRVVTAMVGMVGTKIFDNAPTPQRPTNSFYSEAWDNILKANEECAMPAANAPPEEVAEGIVSDAEKGVAGQIFHGGMAAPWDCTPMPREEMDVRFVAGRGLDKVTPPA